MRKLLLPNLQEYIESLEVEQISSVRTSSLQVLIDYISARQKDEELIILNFVCTHNSRRSQISQIMAQVSACYYDLDVICYSGGTEVTAFHPNAINAIRRVGLDVQSIGESNPVNFVRFSDEKLPLACFSKVHDDAFNKAGKFAAIMTCSHADENCPHIPNAIRIPIRYDDPKRSDGTDDMNRIYDETVRLIAIEMKYVFQSISNG